jgi:hypothetical protein
MAGSMLDGEGCWFEVDLEMINECYFFLWPQCNDVERCIVFECIVSCGLWMSMAL